MPIDELFYSVAFRADDNALSGVNNKIDEMEGKLRGVGRAMQIVGAAIVGLGALAVREFAQVETVLAQIEGLVGISRQQLNDWGDDLKRIAVESGIALSQVAEGLFFVTSAGLRGQIALDTLNAAARGTAVGLGETGTLANLAGAAINAFGDSLGGPIAALDAVATGLKEGILDPATLAPAVSQLITQASDVGVAFQEVVGALAAMSRQGTIAAHGTTQLRQVFATFVKPAAEAERVIEEVGLSVDELRMSLRERGLFATLELLGQTLEANGREFSEVFTSVEALLAVNNLLGEAMESNRQVIDNVVNSSGTLNDAFEVVEQTTQHRLNQAIVGLRSALVDIGAALSPIANFITGTIIPAFTTLLGVMGSSNPVVRVLTQAFFLLGAALAVVGTGLVLLAPGITALLPLLATLRASTLAATVAQWLLNTAMLANPVGIVIAAIAALIGVVTLLVLKWDEVAAKLREVWDLMRRIANVLPFFDFDVAERPSRSESVLGFQQGGMVPGSPGQPVPAILHAGELVVPAHQVPYVTNQISTHNRSSRSTTNALYGDIYIYTQDADPSAILDEVERRFDRRLRTSAIAIEDEVDT